MELTGFEPVTPTLPVWCATNCAIAPDICSCSVELTGFEPVTPTLPVWCATNCAIAPWVTHLNIQRGSQATKSPAGNNRGRV